MAKKKASTEVTPTPEATPATVIPPVLSDEQIAQAATNNPSLSKDEYLLGGKTYRYTHLTYDNYVAFMVKAKPLGAAIIGTVTAKARASINLPGIELEENPMSSLIEFCGKDIPEMAALIVNNFYEASERTERVTAKEIKKMTGVTPMTLANIIMGQIIYNNMISDFASFFVQMMPALRAMGILRAPSQAE